ncbi:hypothetical protein GCM10022247_73270 [Allokutzneria multivorans]|uniref:Zinc finger protein n=1 Tax=Allokutzneria multivorans TaxID=1142134 RepID=A0ABP7U654_9PSEU
MTKPPNTGRGTRNPGRLDPQIFFWQPENGARHAVPGSQADYELGEQGQSLCAQPVRVRAASESEWIAFPTCDKCWQAAKSLHGELKTARPRLL